MKRGRVFKWGGVVSGGVLVAFGIAVIVLALLGRSTLDDELARQQIIGTPDMSPAGIPPDRGRRPQGRRHPGLRRRRQADRQRPARAVLRPVHVHPRARGDRRLRLLGDGSVRGQAGSAGGPACAGGGTNNPEFAQIDPVTKQPASNSARDLWVTETALSTGLNVTFMASLLVLFTLLVGVALLLAGVGFIVIGLGLLPPRRAAEEPPPS